MAAHSKVWICGRWPAEVVGSNPAWAWTLFCYECCVLSGIGLSSRGVLPTVVRRCV